MAKYMWYTLYYETSIFTQAFSGPLMCYDSLPRSQRVLSPQNLEIAEFICRIGHAFWKMLGPDSTHTGRAEVYRAALIVWCLAVNQKKKIPSRHFLR